MSKDDNFTTLAKLMLIALHLLYFNYYIFIYLWMCV